MAINQLGELKIKVHLPLKCSGQMLTNPDKVVDVEPAKPLSGETFNGLLHLDLQEKKEIELKLWGFKLDLGGR